MGALENTSSVQVQLVEELMSIKLFLGKTGYITKISTQMLDTDPKAIMACLKNKADVFAFSSTDLT